MAQFDPNPPTFDVKYDIGKVPDIGSGYAAGIESAGKSIAGGISNALDVMNRRQNATDMLNAMVQGGMLSPDAYKAIAGKSLGAQEQMLGMYANQWVLDQAQQRQLSLARGQGGVEVATQHAKMLDLLNIARGQGGAGARVAGLPGGGPWTGGGQGGPPAGQAATVQNPAVTPPSPSALNVAQDTARGFGGSVGAPPPRPGVQPPGTRYVQRTDPNTGKVQTGTLYPSGQFIPD